MTAVRERITRMCTRREAVQSNSLRSDGGIDEFEPVDVWELVDEVEYSPHFLRWFAILELDRDGVYPINSTAVKRRVREMLDANAEPNRQSVLGSMVQFEQAGALEREELDGESGYHWTPTEEGYQFARGIAIQWCDVLGCEEAVDALADVSKSIDSDE